MKYKYLDKVKVINMEFFNGAEGIVVDYHEDNLLFPNDERYIVSLTGSDKKIMFSENRLERIK